MYKQMFVIQSPEDMRNFGTTFLKYSTQMYMQDKKGRDLTQSYDKSHYTNRNVKRAKWQNKQRQKSSITQCLRQPVGVTTATQLVWLTGLLARLATPRNSRVIKRTLFKKMCK